MAPPADAYFTISDETVALEFMLRFDGVLVPEDEYNHILAVFHAGGIISR